MMAIEIGGTHGTFWIVGQFDVSGTGVADGVLSQNPGSELAISGRQLDGRFRWAGNASWSH